MTDAVCPLAVSFALFLSFNSYMRPPRPSRLRTILDWSPPTFSTRRESSRKRQKSINRF